jgi:DNA helicase-2/ATP-dependent DNA helicase PcrA
LVLAGAGSGKTRVIIERIARILRHGSAPERIIGVTFTNKAAREMRARLRALVPGQAARVHLSTFHSLGLTLLREEHQAAGLPQNFCIFDGADQLGLVRELLRGTQVADRRLDAPRVLDHILRAKREGLAEVPIDWGDDYELAAHFLYDAYRQQMQAFAALDFDDLLLRALEVLQDAAVAARWGRRFQHVLVDEFQDTNQTQLRLLRCLTAHTRDVCVVGDDDQAIYGWRGAVADSILSFPRHYPGTLEVKLEQNYRSTHNILAAANHVIRQNPRRRPKELWTASEAGPPVRLVRCPDGDEEAEFVAGEIERLRFDGARAEGVAVLYRSNVQAQLMEESLHARGIDYRMRGGQAFFDRKDVRDLLAYLSVCLNPRNEVALRRIINVPARGIGPKSLQLFAKRAKSQGFSLFEALRSPGESVPAAAQLGAESLVELIQGLGQAARAAPPVRLQERVQSLVAATGLRDAVLAANDAPGLQARRLGSIDRFLTAVGRFAERGANLEAFVADSALDADAEESDAEGRVQLMTLHSAKGLEFDHVFFIGVEEGLLPHQKTLDEGTDLSEERRLCYVGITRARQSLCLSLAAARLRHGQNVPRTPSRFLEGLGSLPGVTQRTLGDPGSADDGSDGESMAKQLFAQIRAL